MHALLDTLKKKTARSPEQPPTNCGPDYLVDEGIQFYAGLLIMAHCGAFVGTDVSFGAANWLAPVVGIQSHFTTARAAVAAGLSTSIGFAANMVVQAAALPAKVCWIDPDYTNPRAA